MIPNRVRASFPTHCSNYKEETANIKITESDIIILDYNKEIYYINQEYYIIYSNIKAVDVSVNNVL